MNWYSFSQLLQLYYNKFFKKYQFLERPMRFELINSGFADPCLTIWLWTHGTLERIRTSGSRLRRALPSSTRLLGHWAERWDLNPRHSEPQSDALPSELLSATLEERVGFEPTEPFGSIVFKTISIDLSDTSPLLTEAIRYSTSRITFRLNTTIIT